MSSKEKKDIPFVIATHQESKAYFREIAIPKKSLKKHGQLLVFHVRTAISLRQKEYSFCGVQRYVSDPRYAPLNLLVHNVSSAKFLGTALRTYVLKSYNL